MRSEYDLGDHLSRSMRPFTTHFTHDLTLLTRQQVRQDCNRLFVLVFPVGRCQVLNDCRLCHRDTNRTLPVVLRDYEFVWNCTTFVNHSQINTKTDLLVELVPAIAAAAAVAAHCL